LGRGYAQTEVHTNICTRIPFFGDGEDFHMLVEVCAGGPALGNTRFASRWTASYAKALLVTTYGVPPMFALVGMGNTAPA
jgi:hypothetical protein